MTKNREGFPAEEENNNENNSTEKGDTLEEGEESKESGEITENRVIEIVEKIRKIDFEKNELSSELSVYMTLRAQNKYSNEESLAICKDFLSRGKKTLELLKDKDVIRFCERKSIDKDKDYLESFFVKGMEKEIKSLSE